MADLDPQSILARSQAQTEASLRNVKKLNRQAWVVSGLSAYDQVRRQQAIERANRVYSEGSRYLQQQERFLGNLTQFWKNHEETYTEDPVNWTPYFWNNRVDSYLDREGLEKNQENRERWDSIFRQDPLVQAEFDEYQRLYNLYSNVDFDRRSMTTESDESYEARQAAWTQSERRRLLDLRNNIAREGGMWHDIKTALGLNTGSDEIAFSPEYTFQIPSDVSASTRELLESMFHRKEMIDAINQQSGAYDAAKGESIIARTIRARRPDEATFPFSLSEQVFEGESAIRDYLSQIFSYNSGFTLGSVDRMEGLQSTRVENEVGDVVPLEEFITLRTRSTDEDGNIILQPLRLVSVDGEEKPMTLRVPFELANDSANLVEQPRGPDQMMDNLRDRMLITKNYLQVAAQVAKDRYDRPDIGDYLISLSENNVQLMKLVFESGDFRDILGISRSEMRETVAQDGERVLEMTDSPNFIRVSPGSTALSNSMMLNRINNLTLSGDNGIDVVNEVLNTSPATLSITGNPEIDRIAQQIYLSVLASYASN